MLPPCMAELPRLRLMVPLVDPGTESRRPPEPHRGPRTGRIVSVGGGKGGVGKSLVAASLGIDLARRGSRVVLVDCDLGGANLHTCLGIGPPRRTLSEFVNHEVERIEDVVVPTGIPNLSLVSGALDGLDAANPKHGQKMRFLRHLQSMDVDFAVLDLAAGTQKNTIDFFLLADHKVLVLAPEPSSVENAHRFVKAAYWRRLRATCSIFGVADLLDGLLADGRYRTPSQVLDAIEEADADTGRQLREQTAAFRPGLVVNQNPHDRRRGARAWRRSGLAPPLRDRSGLPRRCRVRRRGVARRARAAAAAPGPLPGPGSAVAGANRRPAPGHRRDRRGPQVKPVSEQTLYEVLEVPRSATPHEVRRAYERARALFGPGSLASYTLLDPGEAESLSLRIEEARSVLLDPQARAAYDQRLPEAREPAGHPAPAVDAARVSAAPDVRRPSVPGPGVPPTVLGPPDGSPWTGGLIRQAREATGLSVLDLSDRTKVQRSCIESIEAERFDQLPPAVYLRGIVLSIADALRLDGQAVARSYVERAAAGRAPARSR